MTSKSSRPGPEEGALPPAIIAQAEAAIYGNSAGGRTSGAARSSSYQHSASSSRTLQTEAGVVLSK